MAWLGWVAIAVAVLPALLWIVGGVAAAKTLRSIALLDRDRSPPPATWPSLTVVTPACNEAESVEGSLASLLRQDYPALDLVAVDDRSTDATGAILNRLGRAEQRLTVLHVTELPEGWLGKVHALHRGTQAAQGEWILFADADVQFAPGALRRAVAYAEAQHLDLLTAFPEVLPFGLLGDATFAAATALLMVGGRLWKVRDPASQVAVGLGAFILVRRTAFARSPGFWWLRLEVADDMGLGLLIKQHGGRCDVVNGAGLIRLQWYASFTDMMLKMQKNYFAILSRFSLARAAGLSGVLAWISLFPLMLWVPGVARSPLVVLVVGLGWLSLLGTSAVVARWSRRPVVPALMVQLGLLANVGLLARSAWIGIRQGGITWRGKLYSTALLGGNQRFKV